MDDLISRQAVLENAFEVDTKEYGRIEVVGVDAISDLSTIGIMHCKDCKFSFVDGVEADGVEPFRACKLRRDSEATYGLWVVSDDDYCSLAEPKDE